MGHNEILCLLTLVTGLIYIVYADSTHDMLIAYSGTQWAVFAVNAKPME